jgi:hypothetical protein
MEEREGGRATSEYSIESRSFTHKSTIEFLTQKCMIFKTKNA